MDQNACAAISELSTGQDIIILIFKNADKRAGEQIFFKYIV